MTMPFLMESMFKMCIRDSLYIGLGEKYSLHILSHFTVPRPVLFVFYDIDPQRLFPRRGPDPLRRAEAADGYRPRLVPYDGHQGALRRAELPLGKEG